MHPLQYTSEEMFSSTELIRKSKLVFDKLHKKDIEKAIILRDGKPSFMLLDFSVYEKIMNEYLNLKELYDSKNISQAQTIKKETSAKPIENTRIIEERKILEEKIKPNELDAIDEVDLEEALAQIDSLDLESFSSSKNEETLDVSKDEKKSLKEFWE
ncbi:MAG: hypothetical protein WBF48_08615 [Halarcobacter sp.]